MRNGDLQSRTVADAAFWHQRSHKPSHTRRSVEQSRNRDTLVVETASNGAQMCYRASLTMLDVGLQRDFCASKANVGNMLSMVHNSSRFPYCQKLLHRTAG